jgi:Leucine-rich repeat (LRR) protein
MAIEKFPDAVGGVLKRLECLELRDNALSRLPSALSQITTLHNLDLSLNDDMQLERSNVDTLAALPNLRVLDLAKSQGETGIWSQASVAVLFGIMKRLPDSVQMPGFK